MIMVDKVSVAWKSCVDSYNLFSVILKSIKEVSSTDYSKEEKKKSVSQ
jgi:hypothetical protein